jgi:hypothetical protein
MVAWLERARKQLGNKTQEECIAIVKQPRKPEDTASQFAGRVFPDICLDVEGTLFTDEGVLREDILNLAQSQAAVEKRPITIWTGGDIEKIRPMVRKAGIAYKLVHKQVLRGATVGHVIDDMAQDEFSNTYQIGWSEAYQPV